MLGTTSTCLFKCTIQEKSNVVCMCDAMMTRLARQSKINFPNVPKSFLKLISYFTPDNTVRGQEHSQTQEGIKRQLSRQPSLRAALG